MSDSRFPRRTIDDEIDRVVRDLVELDPMPGLRRRVLSRLERTDSTFEFGPRVFVPVGVLLVLLIGVLVWRPNATPSTPQVVAQNPASASPPAAATRPTTPALSQLTAPEVKPVPRVTRAVTAPKAVFGPPSGRVTATSLAGRSAARSAAVLADAVPRPGTREDVPAFTPIAIAPIRIVPLELQRLSVPPLSGRDQ